MRRKAGLVLLALAVFFAALSPLLRWYAFPRLAKVPAGQYQDMVLEAKDATLLDYGTMRAKKVSRITIVQTLKGDMEAARRVAHTQEPVHARGESVDGDPVRREGIEFKWPFLTERRDYAYFDAQARITAPIHYKGTRDFCGVEVCYFERTIPWTKVPFPKTMPVKGITAESVEKTGTTRWYTTVRRFWVEPLTGAPVYGEETTRRNCAAAPSSAAARRSPPSPGT